MKRPDALIKLAIALLMLTAAPLLAESPLTPMIDAHAHYTAEDAAALMPQQIIAKLDASGVSHLAVSGSPPELAQQLYRHAPDRVIPLLGVYGTGLSKTNWMQDPDLPKKAATWLKTGRWAGIGELHLFAQDAGSLVFAELVRLAAAQSLVLMIHGDAEVVDKALELAPDLRVLWAHLGTDPRPEILAAMLARHPGKLWIDTSVRDERIAPNGKLLPQWRALFERHPDRFLVAVDTFSLNRWQNYEAVTGQVRAWIEPLPLELKRKLLQDNAAHLFEIFLDR